MDAISASPRVTRALEARPRGLQDLAFGVRHRGDGGTPDREHPTEPAQRER